ncbi:MAG: hypothetical protein VX589_15910 [Myxococcota bacterium]|nr:hypothetical protein [Myxococcota bacterium]
MKKFITILVVLAAVGAGAYWYTQPTGSSAPVTARYPARIGSVLPAKSTVAMGTIEHLDKVFTHLNDFAKETLVNLPDEFRIQAEPILNKEKRDALLGFDLLTSAGWSSIGIDASAGLSVVADSTLVEDGEPMPLVLLKITDRAKLVAALSAQGTSLSFSDKQGPSELMTIAGIQSLVGEKAGYTVVLPGSPGSSPAAALRTKFDNFLTGKTPALVDDSGFTDAVGHLADGGRAMMYLATDPLLKIATSNAPAGTAALSAVDQAYYAERFPAFGLGISAEVAQAQLVATPAGTVILNKLFRPKSDPKLSQYVPGKNWSAIRYSLNVEQLFEGVGELIPPSKAEIKMGLAMGQALIAGQIGVSWMDISAALDGHFMLATELASLTALKTQNKADLAWLGVVGIREATKAKRLMTTLKTKLESPSFADITVEPIDLNGAPGLILASSGFTMSVVQTKDAFLIGPNTAILSAAINGATAGQFSSTDAGQAIDQSGAVSVVVVQLETILKALQADETLPDDTKKALQAFVEDPTRRQTIAAPNVNAILLNKGLQFRSSGLMSLAILAGLSGAALMPVFLSYQ